MPSVRQRVIRRRKKMVDGRLRQDMQSTFLQLTSRASRPGLLDGERTEGPSTFLSHQGKDSPLARVLCGHVCRPEGPMVRVMSLFCSWVVLITGSFHERITNPLPACLTSWGRCVRFPFVSTSSVMICRALAWCHGMCEVSEWSSGKRTTPALQRTNKQF